MLKKNNENIFELKKILRKRLIDDIKLDGYENERQEIFNLMQQTITIGESNSVLVIDPTISRKTKIMESILEKLKEIPNYQTDSIVVELNGLIHTDDRVALQGITTKMGLDNYADGKVFGSFADNLSFLLNCLKSGDKKAKSVLFILKEFDLFCFHHNQTLLYNLFDISQSAQTPICVVCITSRLDVLELLEKRVKSRFSHRQIFIFDEIGDKPDVLLDTRLNRLENWLFLPDKIPPQIASNFRKQWNNHVKGLIANKQFRNNMQRLLDIDRDEQTLINFLIMLITELDGTSIDRFNPGLFEEKIEELIGKDETIETLRGLSGLELCLLIAIKHHVELFQERPMNFEMIITRYLKFANTNTSIHTTEKQVIFKALDHLQSLELIGMISSGNNRVQREYQCFKLLVLPEQINEVVKSSSLPTDVVQWASCSFA